VCQYTPGMSEMARLGPVSRPRLYAQVVQRILAWIEDNGLGPGDRLPPERELAGRLGVSRATVSQALVAMEVVGVIAVRHGDGAVIVDASRTARPSRVVDALNQHAERLPDVLEAREALECKLAALAAVRRTEEDLARIDAALEALGADVEAGGHGVEGDERFHAAVAEAAHSGLLQRLAREIADQVQQTRIEALSQPGRPLELLAGHRRIARAVREQDPEGAAAAMRAHIDLVGAIALLRG